MSVHLKLLQEMPLRHLHVVRSPSFYATMVVDYCIVWVGHSVTQIQSVYLNV